MSILVKRLRVYGDVQGVGFRYSFQLLAKKEGVKGWVRNRQDGSVEAVIQGHEKVVQEVIAWARHGPPLARVENVVVNDETGEFSEFSIRDTL